MWEKGVTWLLAFLALASSAGWLAGRRSRSLKVMKAESDLLANLPPGQARADLERHIAASVSSYLRRREEQDRAVLVHVTALVTQLAGVPLLIVAQLNGAGLLDDWDKAPDWAAWTGLAGAVLIMVGVLVETVMVLREAWAVRAELKLDGMLQRKTTRSAEESSPQGDR